MTDGLEIGMRIFIRGIVQGVGFRPFIYTLADRYRLTGWVRNTSGGVEIEVNGAESVIREFIADIRSSAPPLSRIDELTSEITSPNGYATFAILSSAAAPEEFIPISPDVTVCPACQAELFDPANRRYRYPFINCTHCGPRFTIIKDIPYDRPNTTMADFHFCPDCEKEYHDPVDRRFHAQPVACPVCGPQVWFEANGRVRSRRDEAILEARKYLKAGKIIAVKGLGGYHLVCDASSEKAVVELRRRKQRSEKPFALMAFDLAAVQRHCLVSPQEEALLCSRQRPIVLLTKKSSLSVSRVTAPGQATLGIMLPYTPLHLLLMEPAAGFPDLLVMTSGNMSEEPIAYEDDDARQRLSPLVDGFLFHDRPIYTRVDDSVYRVIQGAPYPTRRSRGYAPDSIRLAQEVPQILGAGAELKNTFCLTRGKYAFVSHHIGDMENVETLNAYETGVAHYERLFRIKPEIIACDLHPNYLATRYAQARSTKDVLPLVPVQHHHAHLAACLADNGWDSDEPVIGLCFDGTGYGVDGAIWGGEALVGSYSGYQRAYHLSYTPLPGGDQAVRKPSRMALAYLWKAGMDWDPDLPPVQALCAEERTVLKSMLTHRINTPLTSSIGRLFDAASALIGIRQVIDYEGQAAIEMEALADPDEPAAYPIAIENDIVDPAPLISALLADFRAGTPLDRLSARFHNSVVDMAEEICRRVRTREGIQTVALSGGVWQNRYLVEHSITRLEKAGFRVLIHRQLPPNDGCISLGQVMVAAHTRAG